MPGHQQPDEQRDRHGDTHGERAEDAPRVLRSARHGEQCLAETDDDDDEANGDQDFHFDSPPAGFRSAPPAIDSRARAASSSRRSLRTVATTVAMATPMRE